MGTLAVEISDDYGQTWVTRGRRTGDQDEYWHEGVIDLTPCVGSVVKIRFTATTGNGYNSDIAIDDIAIGGPPSARVVYPSDRNVVWRTGEYTMVRWSGFRPTYLMIELYKGNIPIKTIIDSVMNMGQMMFGLATAPLGSDYRVKVTSLSSPLQEDYSDHCFTITDEPSLEAALDLPLVMGVTTGGDVNWFGQRAEYCPGRDVDAAQSGAISFGQETWMRMTIDVPASSGWVHSNGRHVAKVMLTFSGSTSTSRWNVVSLGTLVAGSRCPLPLSGQANTCWNGGTTNGIPGTTYREVPLGSIKSLSSFHRIHMAEHDMSPRMELVVEFLPGVPFRGWPCDYGQAEQGPGEKRPISGRWGESAQVCLSSVNRTTLGLPVFSCITGTYVRQTRGWHPGTLSGYDALRIGCRCSRKLGKGIISKSVPPEFRRCQAVPRPRDTRTVL